MKRLFVLVTMALLAAACSSSAEVSSSGLGSGRLGCSDSPGAVVELLRQGSPTYDYDPAANLEELIDRVDLVVTGTLFGAVRVGDPSDFEASTRIEIAEAVVLASSGAQVEGDYAADGAFGTDAVWADGASADPLGERVEFDPGRTRFVAFLHSDGQGGFRVDVQGLHVGCANGPLEPVLEPLPGGTSAQSADDLTAAIQAIADPVVPRDEANFESVPYRLIAEDVAEGEPYTARRVTNPSAASPGVGEFESDDPPTEVFFEFVLAESGSCPLGPLDRLEFDRTTRLLYPVLNDPSSQGSCTADANPHLVFVAVRRQDLPAGAFAISIGAEGWPNTFEPIAFADGELTRPDPDSIEYPILGDPAELGVGETGILIGYTTHCDASYLWWVVDGRSWVRADGSSSALPGDWRAVERDEQVDLVITRSEPDRIDAVARGADTVVSFVPDPAEEAGCM